MNTKQKIITHLLGALLDEYPPIYFKAIVGEYEKRTDYMEGYNAGVRAYSRLISEICEDFGVDVLDGETCMDVPEVIINEY